MTWANRKHDDVIGPRIEPASYAGLTPPHDLDAETVVLAASIENSPRRGYPRDTALSLVKSEAFYSEEHGRIWAAVEDLARTNKPVHVQSIVGWLRERNRLGDKAEYIRTIITTSPAVMDVRHFAERVARLHRTRRMIAEMQRLIVEGYKSKDDSDTEWCDAAASAIDSMTESGTGAYQGATLLDFSTQAFKDINDRAEKLQRGEATTGIRTHLPDLDRVLGDMMPGNLVVVGAPTGIGKSTLARQCILEWASRKLGGYVLSLEMSGEEVAKSLLFTKARVDSSLLGAEEKIQVAAWGRLAEASAELRDGAKHVWLDDRPDITLDDLSVNVRRQRRECERAGVPFSFIVVDYIQLMTPSRRRRDGNREEEVGAIGRGLKQLAQREGVVVMALAQLNSDADKRTQGGGKPRMSDLRESKAIAQHSNKVVLIHNPHALTRSEVGSSYEDGEDCEIIVAKNRGGRLGPVPVRFRPQWTVFECPTRAWGGR